MSSSIKKKKIMVSEAGTGRCSVHLPDECWEMIFNGLGSDYRFEVISLVSKQFLSVSNHLKQTLTIHDPTIHIHCNLSKIFQRFHRISCISIKCVMSSQEFNDILLDISRSVLDLKELHVSHWTGVNVDVLKELGMKMNNLMTLGCVYEVLKYNNLVSIASSIPQLQALSVNPAHWLRWSVGFLTGEKIELLASNARQLRRIELYENCFVTDKLIMSLSLNCKFLTKLVVGSFALRHCQLTENGIGFALRHCQNLTSLGIHSIKSNNFSPSVPSSLFSFENSISHARALCDIDIQHMIISDSLLCSIAKARLPLKMMSLWCCENFTYSGLSVLLQEYQSINHLRLGSVKFLTDHVMKDLSMFLPNVSHLEICGGDQLTDSTFFILTENCPCLVELELKYISLGRGGNFHLEQAENQNIKSLRLNLYISLNDKSLISFGLVCPNLKLLDLSYCYNITQKGIGEILKSCSKLTHLEVGMREGGKVLGTGSDLSKLNLEVLRLSSTAIDNRGMSLIGRRCRGLLQLELYSCLNFTQNGVKEVLKKCVKLREINMCACREVSIDMVPWMMSTRPSLRKIVLPCKNVSKEEQRNMFLRYGCVVSNY